MKAIKLRTAYLKNPIGIDTQNPCFYWKCEGGKKQTAYQITVKRNEEEIWNTGKVNASSMTHIEYKGKELRSREELIWNVSLWDENDIQGEWSEGSFEMGLLEAADWTAKWISGNYKHRKNMRYPVDCFKKEFSVSKKIKKARIYASARGLYDIMINGNRIEDFILAPGMTDYRKRIQYQTYDVTEYLKKENILEFRLADGWYRGSSAAYGVVNVYGVQTSLIAQLELTYEDGTKKTFVTDKSFAWSNDGAICFADLKDGEIYDARKKPSYSGKALEVKGEENLVASNNVPVREKEVFTPKLLVAKDGTKVLDFGQNIAGYLSFEVKGMEGQTLHALCGEVLDKDGKVDLSGVQETRPAKGWNNINLVIKLLTGKVNGEVDVTPKQEIYFTCSGGTDNYKTSFAIFGFRYVEVHTDIEIHPESFKAIAVYSDMEQTGSFDCSSALVNHLYQNTLWSMKGNFLDLPTDCPTRERLGWTGDAQVFFNTGAYLMNTASFFRKWLVDMEDAQMKNGLLPAVFPNQGCDMMYNATGSSVGWADAIYLIPYRYYKQYGDISILKECWPMIQRYAEYLWANMGMRDKKEGKANPHNAYTYEKGVHLGEWLEPEEFRDKVYGTQAKHPEECTAYFYYSMVTIGEIAELLQEQDITEKCKKYANGAKEAYNALFVKTGLLNTKRQAKIVRPLALGLLDGEEKKKAEELLVKAVEDYDYCVGTGFLSTPFILPTLSEAGETEVAYKMLENTKKPSWLGEVLDGATTIWENWEGNLSQNHYSPGAVCEWLFATVGGIRVVGENHFVISPVPGGSLEYADVSYDSLYGKAESSWKRTDNGVEFTVTIPANTTAEIILPDGRTETVGAGKYEY